MADRIKLRITPEVLAGIKHNLRYPFKPETLKDAVFYKGMTFNNVNLSVSRKEPHMVWLRIYSDDMALSVVAEGFDLQQAEDALGGYISIPVERSGCISVLVTWQPIGHPDFHNCMETGYDGFPTKEAAIAKAKSLEDPTSHVYVLVGQTIGDENPEVLHYIAPTEVVPDTSDEDWRREQAIQNGMGLGIPAYNETMGY